MKRTEAENFTERYSPTGAELRDTIAYLICHREQMRDKHLSKLEMETQKLIERLNYIDRKKILEEIKCFKEILALQKQMLQKNDTTRC